MAESMFQIAGVSTGIGWDEIIKKTLTRAAIPIENWKNQIDKLEIKKTLYQEISSEFFKLRGTLTKMKLESTYKAKTAEFTSHTSGTNAESVAKATVKPGAEIASWDIDVEKVARAQRHISDRYKNPGEPLNIEGSFRIHVGQQVTTIKVEKGDSIRTINQKVRNANDQHGEKMEIVAKLIDNRLVIESATSGIDPSGEKKAEKLTMSESDQMYLPRTSTGKYPSQILRIEGQKVTYQHGRDYTYDKNTGLVTWRNDPDGQRPKAGQEVALFYQDDITITRATGDEDLVPQLLSGEYYDPDTAFEIYDKDGNRFKECADPAAPDVDDDYYIEEDLSDPANPKKKIKWLPGKGPAEGENYILRIGANADYESDYNKFFLEADDMGENSALAKLGFITVDSALPNGWEYKAGSFIEAQNASFTLNGVPITRTTNKIDDLIADVTLEIVGPGKVTMNVTQDAKTAVEGMEAFVEAYNKVMTVINMRLEEKQDAVHKNDEKDLLSSIISQGKGRTEFGLLHGDQLLWSIKDQMRRTMSMPVHSFSSSVATRQFSDVSRDLEIEGSFYVYSAGKAARIDIAKNDSLEDIQMKLQEATNIASSNGETSQGGPLDLDVSIRNGRLFINAPRGTASIDTKRDTLQRNKDARYDYLSYVADSSKPVNGTMTVISGKTVFTEGLDYKVETDTTKNGTLQSKIVWIEGGKSPVPGSSYNVIYEYNKSAVSFKPVPGAPEPKELELHFDSSRTSLSTMGLTTEKIGHGKSGLLEFDSDKFMEALRDDSQNASSVMTTFMKDMDRYIGNLVDSSQMLVAGTPVVKGRIAGKLYNIDKEIGSYSKRISKLESELKDRQAELYKKYSNMEIAMQKLQAQMISMMRYFDSISGKKNNNQN